MQAGLLQSELGARLGVHTTAVSKYESRQVGVSLDKLHKIAAITGCDLGWLVGETDAATHEAARLRAELVNERTARAKAEAELAELKAAVKREFPDWAWTPKKKDMRRGVPRRRRRLGITRGNES